MFASQFLPKFVTTGILAAFDEFRRRRRGKCALRRRPWRDPRKTREHHSGLAARGRRPRNGRQRRRLPHPLPLDRPERPADPRLRRDLHSKRRGARRRTQYHRLGAPDLRRHAALRALADARRRRHDVEPAQYDLARLHRRRHRLSRSRYRWHPPLSDRGERGALSAQLRTRGARAAEYRCVEPLRRVGSQPGRSRSALYGRGCRPLRAGAQARRRRRGGTCHLSRRVVRRRRGDLAGSCGDERALLDAAGEHTGCECCRAPSHACLRGDSQRLHRVGLRIREDREGRNPR